MSRLLALVCLVAFVSVVEAAVLCARRKTDGAFNSTVKIRQVCKPSEVQLDPDGLGLQGPPGPQGEPGICECSTTTMSTTSVPGTSTTSTTIVPACVGTIEIEPDGTIVSLPAGSPTSIPVRITIVSGHNFNLSLQDAPGGGQCLPPPCGANLQFNAGPGIYSQTIGYTPPATPSVMLTASLQPRGAPVTCNQLSQGDTDAKTFTVTP